MSSKKPIKKPRRVRLKKKGDEDKKKDTNKLSASDRLAQTAVTYIVQHPSYVDIVRAMRFGTPNADIVDFYIEKGSIQLQRQTAIQYFAAFRRSCPEVVRPKEPGEADVPSYDHIFDGNTLALDSERELTKLIQLQKSRVSIDFNTERNIGKLFATTQKEVATLGELLERHAKMKGRFGNASGQQGNLNTDAVKGGFAEIEQDEETRSNVARALTDLMGKVKVG